MRTAERRPRTDMVEQRCETSSLYRIMSWLSPAFPVGAYSYSHGLEYAVEDGVVGDRDELVGWVHAVLHWGAGRTDGLLLAAAHRAAAEPDPAALHRVAELALACRSTSELGLETCAQGRAFTAAVSAGWPDPVLLKLVESLEARPCPLAYPVVVGLAAAAHGIPLRATLPAYLQAFAANLVSAGVRLIPLGQTDAVRAAAALEVVVLRVAEETHCGDLEAIGTATPVVDWASASHETQYTRLFRS